LSICENSTIIALHYTFNKMECTFIIHFSLRGIFTINSIICETSAIFSLLICSCQHNLIYFFLDNYTVLRAICFLFWVERTASYHDLYALVFILSIHQRSFTHICCYNDSIMNYR
jgi:hypothetical protein